MIGKAYIRRTGSKGRESAWVSCGSVMVYAVQQGDSWAIHQERGGPRIARASNLRTLAKAVEILYENISEEVK